MSPPAALMAAGCLMLLLIAAARSGSARVGYVHGDALRLAVDERTLIARMDARDIVDEPELFEKTPGELAKHNPAVDSPNIGISAFDPLRTSSVSVVSQTP
jgi:hypothetical protein